MRNLWDPAEAGTRDGEVGLCVYASRLLGRDTSLVLHGGGNTSVKTTTADITGEKVATLHVKGSGWDLATIEAEGFTPLRIERLQELVRLTSMSDAEMVRELLSARLDPGAPAPSVEALLHAILPYDHVLHSHADAILATTDAVDAEARVREIFGDRAIVIPYVMPGFDLVRRCVVEIERQGLEGVEAMVLVNHGLFTFGATAREAYERHVSAVTAAEDHLAAHTTPPARTSGEAAAFIPLELARLRAEISRAAGAPMIVARHNTPASDSFRAHPELASIATRGPLTPDHIIHTKRVPMLGRDVAAYVAEYERYFQEHAPTARTPVTMLDPAPRVVLDAELGFLSAGRRARDAGIVRDIYEHTIDVIERAEQLGGFRTLEPSRAFEAEYWELEQAKLKRKGPPPQLAGEVALVTGAASGIGRAIARELVARGAAVVGVDIDTAVADVHDGADYHGVAVDVTDPGALTDAISAGVERFGGIDMVVAAAGILGRNAPIAEHDPAAWQAVMRVNADSVASLFGLLHPYLAIAPGGGRVVVVGSKNAAAPGPGVSAYSASKAAVTQLARVAALEWARDGIRVNTVHPDAVFDTGLWTEELIAERAARYGLTPEEYRRRNLLGVEIRSTDVAAIVADLCSSRYATVTGAHIPIDGGNERVI